MKVYSLNDMNAGWFIGDFTPTCLRTSDFEVAVKSYRGGDTEQRHVHRIATEITLIVSGRAEMCERELAAGDIIVLEPGEATGFEALENTITAVVKVPSSPADKHHV